jgi:hypothetical protein
MYKEVLSFVPLFLTYYLRWMSYLPSTLPGKCKLFAYSPHELNEVNHELNENTPQISAKKTNIFCNLSLENLKYATRCTSIYETAIKKQRVIIIMLYYKKRQYSTVFVPQQYLAICHIAFY